MCTQLSLITAPDSDKGDAACWCTSARAAIDPFQTLPHFIAKLSATRRHWFF